jgi:protein-disulfide isomerase
MRKMWIVAALVPLLVAVGLPAASLPLKAAESAAAVQLADATDAIYPDDMYLGKPDAKVTVIEYASLSCPHCANFNKDVLPKIKAEYIDKGLVRWIFRDYPLNRPAFQAAILAHCASPMRYFSLVDQLFQSQEYWLTQSDPLTALRQIGASVGVDDKAFEACLNDEALKNKILTRVQEANDKYKVDATPTFVIKGVTHAGELPYDDFKKLLDQALGQS